LADVKVGKVRTVVGSVYIPLGDRTALDKCDSMVVRILQKYHSILISVDANARSSLWDDSCIGLSQYSPSFTTVMKLEEIISKYSLQIHIDGRATYRSGKVCSAPDVTV